MNRHAGRNLLVGLLAVQNDFLAREQLLEIVRNSLAIDDNALADCLRTHHVSDAEQRLLVGLANAHLARCDHDIQQSIAALSGASSLIQHVFDAAGDAIRQLLPKLDASLDPDAQSTIVEPANQETKAAEPATGKSRFRIIRTHARGGLGEVFVARDAELNRDVALKEIQQRYAHGQESRSRFLLEAEITGGLEHPGIVPVYGLGQYDDGRPFYAMRFIRGASLKEAIAEFHQPSLEDASQRTSPGQQNSGDRATRSAVDFASRDFRQLLGRFVDVCNAMQYAHARGVLHRDLKPGNIMLGKYGETLVVDWGLARLTSVDSDSSEAGEESPLRISSGTSGTPTLAGRALGTPSYMPPEQAAGRLDQLGPASDVYSLGATLYHVLTGRPPYRGQHVIDQVQQGLFPHPSTVLSRVPRALESICLKAMSLNPADRYPSPMSLADDIENFLADARVTAHQESAVERTARWFRRHKTWARAGLTAAAIAFLSLGTAVITLSIWNHKYQQGLYLTLTRICEGAMERGDAGTIEDILESGFPNLSSAWRGWEYGCIGKSLNADIAHFRADMGLAHAQFSANEHLLVCSGNRPDSSPVRVALWQVPQQRTVWTHESDTLVTAIAVSPTANRIVLAKRADQNSFVLELWDPENSRLLQAMVLRSEPTTIVYDATGERFAVGAAAGTVTIVEAESLSVLQTLTINRGTVFAVAFEPDSPLLAAGGESTDRRTGFLSLWNLDSNQEADSTIQQYSVTALSFTPDCDCRLLHAGHGYGLIQRLKVVDDAELMLTHTDWEQEANILDFAVGKRWTVAGSADRMVTVVRSGFPFRNIAGHWSPVIAVAMNEEESVIHTVGSSGIVKSWKTQQAQNTILLSPDNPEAGRFICVDISDDGKLIVTGGTEDRTLPKAMIAVWNSAYEKLHQFSAPGAITTDIELSEDGTSMLVVSANAMTPQSAVSSVLIDVEATAAVITTDGTMTLAVIESVCSAAFLNGTQIIAGHTDGRVAIYNLDGTSIQEVSLSDECIVAMDVSDDDSNVAIAVGSSVQILNSDLHTVHTLPTGTAVRRVALSRDGRFLAATTGAFDNNNQFGDVVVWNTHSGTEIFRQAAGDAVNAGVHGLCFSDSGDRLFVTGYDYVTHVVRTADGETLFDLHGHEGPVLDVAVNSLVAPFPAATTSTAGHVIVREAEDWR